MWPGRQLRRDWDWLNGQSTPRLLLIVAAFGSLSCAACIGGLAGVLFVRGQYRYHNVYTPEDRAFVDNDGWGYKGGLPRVGRKLKAEMEAIPDPDTALQLHPEWHAVQFRNGEWMFGYAISIYSFEIGRGTAVIKDSRGRVRIFFGHVRGPNGPLWLPAEGLDDWDRALREDGERHGGRGLREWVPDQ